MSPKIHVFKVHKLNLIDFKGQRTHVIQNLVLSWLCTLRNNDSNIFTFHTQRTLWWQFGIYYIYMMIKLDFSYKLTRI